jgi:hypothetical protein
MEQAAALAFDKLTPEAMGEIVAQVPDPWLEAIPGGLSAAERRAGYLDFFRRRLAAASIFEQEATYARSRLV